MQIHESSPLDLASEEPERLPCLRRLLQLGADVNAADKNGLCTPPSSPSGGWAGHRAGDICCCTCPLLSVGFGSWEEAGRTSLHSVFPPGVLAV